MTKKIARITTLSLLAAAVIAMPLLSRAADVSPNASGTVTPKHEMRGVIPFHGKVAAVDANAMTLTVGNLTLQVSSETKITKNGKPAKLSDAVVGEGVRGAYKKSDDGKLNAATVHFGAKGGGKHGKGTGND